MYIVNVILSTEMLTGYLLGGVANVDARNAGEAVGVTLPVIAVLKRVPVRTALTHSWTSGISLRG